MACVHSVNWYNWQKEKLWTETLLFFCCLLLFVCLIEVVRIDSAKLLVFILVFILIFFRCSCTAGWTGPDCSVDINECDSEPCLNGATCYESVKQGQFVCICPPFYTGDFCHQRFSPCELPYNPCINNSTCLAQVDGNPLCVCKTGKNCCR